MKQDFFERQKAFYHKSKVRLEMSATHQIPQAKNMSYHPLLIKPVFSSLANAEKKRFFKTCLLVFRSLPEMTIDMLRNFDDDDDDDDDDLKLLLASISLFLTCSSNLLFS